MLYVKLKRLNGKLFSWACTSDQEVVARLSVVLTKFPDSMVEYSSMATSRTWLVVEDYRPIMSEWCADERAPYR